MHYEKKNCISGLGTTGLLLPSSFVVNGDENKMKLIEFQNTIDLVAAVQRGEIAKFQIIVENPPLHNRYFGVPNGDQIPSRPQIELYFAQNGITWKFITTAILP